MGCKQSNAGNFLINSVSLAVFPPGRCVFTVALLLPAPSWPLFVAAPRRLVVGGAGGAGNGIEGAGGRVRLPPPWKADGGMTQAKLELDRTVRLRSLNLFRAFKSTTLSFVSVRALRQSSSAASLDTVLRIQA